ncbi:MAG: enoyl-CoA hydratase-related protein [Gammaproteobacteria bacterium]
MTWFELTQDAGVTRLHLNRPEAFNTISMQRLYTLREQVRRLVREARTRALVITSSGRHFCAGMDLAEFGSQEDTLDVGSARRRLRFQAFLADLLESLEALERAPFPVVAAVQGGCVGGGLDIIAACDVRYCSAEAFFCIQEINIGMAADLGVLQRLPKLIPQGVVRELAYSGRRMNAQRALAVGLVNEVLPDPQAAIDAALALAREIAGKSPLAIAVTKRELNYARDHTLAESLEQMVMLQSASMDQAETMTAIAAQEDKRPAEFPDL